MQQRGRKSFTESMAVALLPAQRPEPPDSLTAEQQEQWREIVNRMPPDWFTPETWPMMIQLCRHISNSRRVGHQLEQIPDSSLEDEEGLARFIKLTSLHDREGKAISSLMTRLQLTPRSRGHQHTAQTAIKNTPVRKPWEDDPQ